MKLCAFGFLGILTLLGAPMQVNGQAGIPPINQFTRKLAIDPVVITTIEHYEIRGSSFDELRLELNAKGRGADGTTRGLVTYQFNSEKNDGRCEVRDVRAQCTAKIRLPRWHDMKKAPEPMQEYWKTAYNKLKKHEMGHVDICVDIAKSVEKVLWSTPGNQHCPTVNEEARIRADAVVAGMNARQLAYDEREQSKVLGPK
jgi:predicted secreted Zn-dependent protease